MKIVCIGDSLTYGYRVRRAAVWTALVPRGLPGTEVVNKGINGDTTGGMLARFGTDVIDLRPDAAFIMGGSNDIFFSGGISQAKSNLAAMVFRCMHHGITPVMGVPLPVCEEGIAPEWSPFACGEVVKKQLSDYSGWIIEFGVSFAVPAVDFRECVPADSVERAGFYLDGIHASEEGHRRMAEAVVKTIAKITK